MSDSLQVLTARANELSLPTLAGILGGFGKLPAGDAPPFEISADLPPHVAALARLSVGVTATGDIAALLGWLEARPVERALFAWDMLHNQVLREIDVARLRAACAEYAAQLPRGARRVPRTSIAQLTIDNDLDTELDWLRHLQRGRMATWSAAQARALFDASRNLEAAAIFADQLAAESSWAGGWGADDFPTARRVLREFLGDQLSPVDGTTLAHYVRLRMANATFDTASLTQLLTVDVPQGASEVFRSRATFAWAEAHVRLGRRFVATDALAELASRMPAFEYGRWVLLLTLALDATVDSDNIVKAVDYYLKDFGPSQHLFVELFRYAPPGSRWLGTLLKRLVAAALESSDTSVWAGVCMAMGEGDLGLKARQELLETIEAQLPPLEA